MQNDPTFAEIVDILTPLLGSVEERRALIIAAFGVRSPLLKTLKFGESTWVFTLNLIAVLDDYGEVTPGMTALAVLLLAAREQVGFQRQARIDKLVGMLNPTPSIEIADSIPTVVETSHEKIETPLAETVIQPLPPASEDAELTEAALIERSAVLEPTSIETVPAVDEAQVEMVEAAVNTDALSISLLSSPVDTIPAEIVVVDSPQTQAAFPPQAISKPTRRRGVWRRRIVRFARVVVVTLLAVLVTSMVVLAAIQIRSRARNPNWTPTIQSFDGVDMVLVPAGCFMMGSNESYSDERPVHEQCFDEPFWIDRYEVTQAQFRQFGGVKANRNEFSGDQRPVENITWVEARNFCALRGARLPTEAEWEYAARGPGSLIYPWGDVYLPFLAIDSGYLYEMRRSRTENVGSIPLSASWVGALDMSGNVGEWTSTIYDDYPYSADDGRENMQDTNIQRSLRGGSWLDNQVNVRAAVRGRYIPLNGDSYGGFRCVRS